MDINTIEPSLVVATLVMVAYLVIKNLLSNYLVRTAVQSTPFDEEEYNKLRFKLAEVPGKTLALQEYYSERLNLTIHIPNTWFVQDMDVMKITRGPLFVAGALEHDVAIVILAEKVSSYPSSNYYLVRTQKVMEDSKRGVSFGTDINQEKIGDWIFDVVEVEITEKNTRQKIYAKIFKDYILSIVVSFRSDDDFAYVDNILKTSLFQTQGGVAND